MRTSYLAAVVLVCSVAGISCTSGGGGGGNVCARAATKLRGCGLATDGAFAGCSEPDGADEVCESNCFLKAACGELEMLLCDDNETGGLATCMANCEAQNSFDCGNGETVGTGDRCDGFLDCSNSADEMGCADFTCDDGETIPASFECDGGSPDCTDGSDEVGCNSFTCDDGETIPAEYECDGGAPDCSDGSDEVGCPAALMLTCN